MPNQLVQAYRANLAANGQTDPSTDDELTLQFGNQASAQNQAVFSMYPDFAQDYSRVRDEQAPGIIPEMGSAIKQGFKGVGATLLGGAAALTNSSTLRDKALELQQTDPEDQPTIGSMSDIMGPKDALRYGLTKAAGAIPSLAEGAATALTGAAIGSAIGPEGTVAGGLEGATEGLLERGPIKAAIQRMITSSSEGAQSVADMLVKQGTLDAPTEEALVAAVKEGNPDVIRLISQQVKATAARTNRQVGETALNTLNAYLQSAGTIYNETPDQGSALGLGAIAAIPNTIIPHMLASKLFPDVSPAEAITKSQSYIARLALKTTETAGVGGGAGALQEAANIIAKNLAANKDALDFDDNDWKRIKEAGVAGAIGGAVAGPIVALEGGHGPAPTDKTMPAADPTAGQLGEIPAGAEDVTGQTTPPPPAVDPLAARRAAVSNDFSDYNQEGQLPDETAPEQPFQPDPLAARRAAAAMADHSEESALPDLTEEPSSGGETAEPEPTPPAPEAPAPEPPPQAPETPVAPQEEAPSAPQPEPTETTPPVDQAPPPVESAVAPAPTEEAPVIPPPAPQPGPGKDIPIGEPTAQETQDAPVPVKPAEAAPLAANPLPVQKELPVEPFKFGAVDQKGSIDFRSTGQLADLPQDQVLKKITQLAEGTLSTDGNRSQTRGALVLQAPDGHIVKAGLIIPQKVNDITGARRIEEPALQRFSTNTRDSDNQVIKSIDEGGKHPAVLEDVLNAGYKPIAYLKFGEKPGSIFQSFPSEEAFNNTLGDSLKKPETNFKGRQEQIENQILDVARRLQASKGDERDQLMAKYGELQRVQDYLDKVNQDSGSEYNDSLYYRKLRTADSVKGSIATDKFKQVMTRLTNLGLDVQAVSKEFFREATGNPDAQAATTANGLHMMIAMEDVANGNMGNFVALLHEAAHSIVGQLSDEHQAAIQRAALESFSELRQQALADSQRTGVPRARALDPEDALAEAMGQKLAAEGIPNVPSVIQAAIRWVKDVYYRAVMALQAGFGIQPDNKLALDWVENQLRRMTGGDFDYSLTNIAQRFVPEWAQTAIARFPAERNAGTPGGVVDFLDPLTWKRSQPNADSSTIDGLAWNLKYSTSESDQTRSRVEAAAINKEIEIMRDVYDKSGATDAWESWWKLHGHGDLPEARLAKIEAFVKGESAAKIGDANMTEEMNKEAAYKARIEVERARDKAVIRSATNQEMIDRESNNLVTLSQKKAVMENNFRDAEMHQQMLKDDLKTMVKKSIDGMHRGLDLTAVGGSLSEAIREAAEIGERGNIPDNFKRFLEKGQFEHVNYFNYLREVGRLDLDLADMTPTEIVRSIRRADDNPTLLALSENRPLLAAIAALAHDNADQVDLIHLGRMNNTAEFLKTMAAIKEVTTATEAGLKALNQQYNQGQKAAGLTERIRQKLLQRRAEYRRLQETIKGATSDVDALNETVVRLAPHIDTLQQQTGAHFDWKPANGETYTAKVRDDDGSWTTVNRTLVANQDGTFANADQIDRDRASTRLWLNENKEKEGTAAYNLIKRQNYELTMIDHRQQYYAHWRGFMDRLIQPMMEKLKGIGGAAGQRAATMMLHFQAILKDHWKGLEVDSKYWTKALTNAEKQSGITDHARFNRQIYNHVMYALGAERGLDEEQAVKLAVKVARARLTEKEGPNFVPAIRELVARTKAVNDRLVMIAQKHGVFVDDPNITSGMRDLVNRGYLTVMRKTSGKTLYTITNDMLKAGWKLQYEKDASDPQQKKLKVLRASTFDGLTPDMAKDGQQLRQNLADKFTPGIISRWLEPFMNKPGTPVFSYDGVPISQLDVGQAWHQNGGDVVGFMDGLAKQLNLKATPEGESPLPEFRVSILKQMDNLFGLESKIAWDAQQTRSLFDPQGPKPHAMMDARVNDLLPAEHLEFQRFDPDNARTILGVLGFHAALGRNGEKMIQAIDEMKARNTSAVADYTDIATHAYDKNVRMTEAERRGLNWKDLENASKNQRDVEGVQAELEHLFGLHNNAGPLGDISGGLKALSFMTGQIVNNPKTGLFNVISLFNRPLIQRDLSLNTAGASADAAQLFARGVIGQMFHRMGLNIIHEAEYTDDVANVERSKMSELPFGVALASTGKDGSEQASFQDKWMIRPMNRIGDFQKWTAFPGIGGIMNFISQESATANGVANIRQFERMIKRGIKYFQQNPDKINDPTYRFTAKDLGMNNAGGFGSEGVFDYYKRRALDYRIGNIEDIAREAMQRQQQGQRLLTTEQALGVSLMAANELNQEASVNTRIGAINTNPILKYGMPLLGWPIQQMNAVNQALKTVDGQRNLWAATKTIGRIAAWSLPVGIAFSLTMDQYDEKLLGKRSNVAPIDPIAALPPFGPVAALLGFGKLTPEQNLLAMFERQSRAGTYGLMGDFITGMVSPQIDPAAGQKAFSLDERVMVFSQLQTMVQTINNLINQHGEATYATVWGPLTRALGGNGVLHSVDLLNHALGLDNQEARMTQRTNAQSWLRAAGRETGVELQSQGGDVSSPTPMTPWIREMQLAAYANDRLDFQEAYRKALDAARQMGEPDPQAKVVQSWKSRDPLHVFRGQPTPAEMSKMYAVMDASGQEAVKSALNLFRQYTNFIAPSVAQKELSREARAGMGLSARKAVLSY